MAGRAPRPAEDGISPGSPARLWCLLPEGGPGAGAPLVCDPDGLRGAALTQPGAAGGVSPPCPSQMAGAGPRPPPCRGNTTTARAAAILRGNPNLLHAGSRPSSSSSFLPSSSSSPPGGGGCGGPPRGGEAPRRAGAGRCGQPPPVPGSPARPSPARLRAAAGRAAPGAGSELAAGPQEPEPEPQQEQGGCSRRAEPSRGGCRGLRRGDPHPGARVGWGRCTCCWGGCGGGRRLLLAPRCPRLSPARCGSPGSPAPFRGAHPAAGTCWPDTPCPPAALPPEPAALRGPRDGRGGWQGAGGRWALLPAAPLPPAARQRGVCVRAGHGEKPGSAAVELCCQMKPVSSGTCQPREQIMHPSPKAVCTQRCVQGVGESCPHSC